MHQLKALLGSNLRAQSDVSESFCRVSGEELDLMGFWTRIQAHGPSPMRMVLAGAAKLPFVLGIRSLRAAAFVKSEIDRDLLECVNGADGWYLNNMVVHSRLRGTGVGSSALRQEIVRLRQSDPTSIFALSTQKLENVRFYSRIGFKSARESEIRAGSRSFRNWTMLCRRAA